MSELPSAPVAYRPADLVGTGLIPVCQGVATVWDVEWCRSCAEEGVWHRFPGHSLAKASDPVPCYPGQHHWSDGMITCQCGKITTSDL